MLAFSSALTFVIHMLVSAAFNKSENLRLGMLIFEFVICCTMDLTEAAMDSSSPLSVYELRLREISGSAVKTECVVVGGGVFLVWIVGGGDGSGEGETLIFDRSLMMLLFCFEM